MRTGGGKHRDHALALPLLDQAAFSLNIADGWGHGFPHTPLPLCRGAALGLPYLPFAPRSGSSVPDALRCAPASLRTSANRPQLGTARLNPTVTTPTRALIPSGALTPSCLVHRGAELSTQLRNCKQHLGRALAFPWERCSARTPPSLSQPFLPARSLSGSGHPMSSLLF